MFFPSIVLKIFLSFVYRTDPVRPFISGHVANSMAAEVIALLHSLLMAPESNAAQIWTTTAEKVSKQKIRYQTVHQEYIQ